MVPVADIDQIEKLWQIKLYTYKNKSTVHLAYFHSLRKSVNADLNEIIMAHGRNQ